LTFNKQGSALKIGVFQAWGMGDLIMTLPVLQELCHLNDRRIDLIVRGKAQAALLRDSPLVNQIFEMPPDKGRLGVLSFFWSLRRLRLDAVFIGARIHPMAALLLRFISGIPNIIGDGNRFSWAYTIQNRLDSKPHRVDQMLETLSLWTGRPASEPVFKLPISAEGTARGKAFLESNGIPKCGYVAFHPGGSKAGGLDKRLPTPLVKKAIVSFRAQAGISHAIVLLGPDDIDLLPQYTPTPDGVALLMSSSLDETKYILSQAAAFIGSASGLGHIASAFGVPNVQVVGPTNPVDTKPYGSHSLVVRSLEEFACRPCWFTELQGKCPYEARCMTSIKANQLVDALKLQSAATNLVTIRGADV
jgi:heptosyltransferase-2